MGVEVADHPAAAVEVDEQRLRRLAARRGRRRAAPVSPCPRPGSQLVDPRHRSRRPADDRRPRRGSPRAPARPCGPRPAMSRRSASPAPAASGCRAPAPGRRSAAAARAGAAASAARARTARDEPVLDLGGEARRSHARQATRLRDVPNGKFTLGTASLAGRGDGGSDDKRSAAGQPGTRATPATQPAAAASRSQTAIWSRQARRLLYACQDRYGDMFTLHIAYEGTWVMLADPDAVKQVFTGDPQGLPRRRGQPDPRTRPRQATRSSSSTRSRT